MKRWTRKECRTWLTERLHPGEPCTIVAVDFGLGLPWGADQHVFGCKGWRPMIDKIAALYGTCGTARSMADLLNAVHIPGGPGPYRFNEDRADFRFYLQRGLGYYRPVEAIVPQAISQWYLGSGGTVGFHTITGLATLAELMDQRDQGTVQFTVWPQETDDLKVPATGHVIVECYPSIFPKLDPPLPELNQHQADAWRVVKWLRETDQTGELGDHMTLREVPFGRNPAVSFASQVQSEGWIIGVS